MGFFFDNGLMDGFGSIKRVLCPRGISGGLGKEPGARLRSTDKVSVARSGKTDLEATSCDLITVAQAFTLV